MEMLEKFREPLSPLLDVRKFLYIVQPGECTFERIQDVPYYFSEVFPLFIGLVCAEYVALAMKGESPRLSESLNSLAHGILSETFKIVTMGIEISMYIFIHRNYRLFDLPWDNPLTWYLALLGVDFAYYWAHRASHEVNVLWALHQIHHSSEDFNIAVAVRHPITHNWINSYYRWPALLQWSKIQSTWTDVVKSWLYGPSWISGAPRLGRDSDKVDIKPRPKFIVILPKWLQAYILIHFFMVCLVFQEFAFKKGNLDEGTVVMTVAYLLITLTSIGLLSEGNPGASYFELFRCSTFLLLLGTTARKDIWLHGAVNFYFVPSTAIWIIFILYQGIAGTKQDIGQGHQKCVKDEGEMIEEGGKDERKSKIFNWSSVKGISNYDKFGHTCNGERESSIGTGNQYLETSESFIDQSQRKLN